MILITVHLQQGMNGVLLWRHLRELVSTQNAAWQFDPLPLDWNFLEVVLTPALVRIYIFGTSRRIFALWVSVHFGSSPSTELNWLCSSIIPTDIQSCTTSLCQECRVTAINLYLQVAAAVCFVGASTTITVLLLLKISSSSATAQHFFIPVSSSGSWFYNLSFPLLKSRSSQIHADKTSSVLNKNATRYFKGSPLPLFVTAAPGSMSSWFFQDLPWQRTAILCHHSGLVLHWLKALPHFTAPS